MIRSSYCSRDRITISHNISTVCTTARSISTTKIQRDIYHYSFRFYSRFILGKTKEFISYENVTMLHTRHTKNESSFRRGITIDFSFSYHTYFLYSITGQALFNPNLCIDLSRYFCIHHRTPSDY